MKIILQFILAFSLLSFNLKTDENKLIGNWEMEENNMGTLSSFRTLHQQEAAKQKADFTINGFDLSFEDGGKVLIKDGDDMQYDGKYKLKSDSTLLIKKQGAKLKFMIQELSDSTLNLEIEDVTYSFPEKSDSVSYFTSKKTKLKFKRI